MIVLNKNDLYELDRVEVKLAHLPPIVSQKPLTSPGRILNLLHEEVFKDLDRECFAVLNLRSDLTMSGANLSICSIGTLNQSLVHPREVLKSSILSNAASVVLIHNHPSGKCEPSKEDAEVTDRLMKAYNMIGINVADHIIMTPGREYYSFFEHGKLTFDAPEYETEPARVNLQSQRVAEAAGPGRKDASEGKKSGRKLSEEKKSEIKITERKTSVREKLRTGEEEGKTAGTGADSRKICSSREPQKRKAEHDRI